MHLGREGDRAGLISQKMMVRYHLDAPNWGYSDSGSTSRLQREGRSSILRFSTNLTER
jgi:hypothetical protein